MSTFITLGPSAGAVTSTTTSFPSGPKVGPSSRVIPVSSWTELTWTRRDAVCSSSGASPASTRSELPVATPSRSRAESVRAVARRVFRCCSDAIRTCFRSRTGEGEGCLPPVGDLWFTDRPSVLDQNLVYAGLSPMDEHAVESHRSRAVGSPARTAGALTVVVTGCAFCLEGRVVECVLPDGSAPLLDGLRGRLDGTGPGLDALRDDCGDVLGLFQQDVGEVHGVGVLQRAQLEEVGKPVAVEAVQRSRAVPPGVEQALSAPAPHRHRPGHHPGDTDIEPGGEDDTVDRVLGVTDHDRVLGHARDSSVVGRVDQGDVLSVERLQVMVT